MKFKKVQIEDINKLEELLKNYNERVCDISQGNLVFWRDYYDVSYTEIEGQIVLKYKGFEDKPTFYCGTDKNAIEAVLDYSNGSAHFGCLSPKEKDFLCENYKCSEVNHYRDWDDYIYNSADIMYLKGRHFNGQRNHINKFKKLYTNYTFEEITKENAEEVKAFCYCFFHELGRQNVPVDEYEEIHICEQIDNIDVYGQATGVLKVDGKVVGFSIGEVVGKTLIIHTEKADTRYQGAYPMLVQLFAQKYALEDGFINREEDCGEEGLRVSKLSYHPICIQEKYDLQLSKQ